MIAMRGRTWRAIRAIGAIVLDASWRLSGEDGWAISSHIALATLTSLFPFLIFLTALAGFFGSQNLSDEAAKLIFDAWPPIVANPIVDEVHNVLTAPRGGLLTIGAILALYFSSGAIEALRVGLNRAYRDDRDAAVVAAAAGIGRLCADRRDRPAGAGLSGRALAADLGRRAGLAPGLAALQGAVTFARLAIASFLMAISLLIAHRWLPVGRRTFVEIAPGVVLTFVSCLAFGEFFGAYLGEFARNYVSTYAGLASVMIALVFLYSMAAIFVFGGDLNAAIMRGRGAAPTGAVSASAPPLSP